MKTIDQWARHLSEAYPIIREQDAASVLREEALGLLKTYQDGGPAWVLAQDEAGTNTAEWIAASAAGNLGPGDDDPKSRFAEFVASHRSALIWAYFIGRQVALAHREGI